MIESSLALIFCQCRDCGEKQRESPSAFRRAAKPRCSGCGGLLEKVGSIKRQNLPPVPEVKKGRGRRRKRKPK